MRVAQRQIKTLLGVFFRRFLFTKQERYHMHQIAVEKTRARRSKLLGDAGAPHYARLSCLCFVDNGIINDLGDLLLIFTLYDEASKHLASL